MLTIIIALATGIASGTVTGSVLGLWLSRRPRSREAPPDYLVVDPDLDRRITQASAQWGAARHRPEAAGLVADKLRLLYALSQRRARRKRWSR